MEKETNAKYLSAYLVTRHYGGHEEGGWYFNWYEWLESHNIEKHKEEEIEQLKKELLEKHKEEEYGNINSVLGGAELTIFFEDCPMEFETTGKPTYE